MKLPESAGRWSDLLKS